jgi:hypothetical protein
VSENRLAVAPTITGGFSLKRYRKGTRLVQEHPLSAWIWRGWNGRQNVVCSDKTPHMSRPLRLPSCHNSSMSLAPRFLALQLILAEANRTEVVCPGGRAGTIR